MRQSTVDTLARCHALALAAMPVPGPASAPQPPRCGALALAAIPVPGRAAAPRPPPDGGMLPIWAPASADAVALACFSEKGRAFILAVLDRLP